MNARNRNQEVEIKEHPDVVDYVVYRDSVQDNQWVVKRIIIALIVTIALLFISNMAWLVAWNLYDYSTTTATVDSQENGIANFTGGNGGIILGEDNRPTSDTEAPDTGDTGNPNP